MKVKIDNEVHEIDKQTYNEYLVVNSLFNEKKLKDLKHFILNAVDEDGMSYPVVVDMSDELVIINDSKVKDCIKGKVQFDFYRKGFLHYKCENGFSFKVPISDTGDAAFNREDKGILFMRYIRKELKDINESKS